MYGYRDLEYMCHKIFNLPNNKIKIIICSEFLSKVQKRQNYPRDPFKFMQSFSPVNMIRDVPLSKCTPFPECYSSDLLI